MTDSKALEMLPRPNPDPKAPSPIGVTEALRRLNRPFNHELFQQRLRALREFIVESGGIVFFPLVWGSPYPKDKFADDNQLVINYDPDNLATYDPEDMSVEEVQERVREVQTFERLRFPTKPSRFNQMNGIATMTDAEGNVSISINCPYPFILGTESPVKYDSALPVAYPEDSFTTRVYYAAYLRAMGCDSDFIYKALAIKPRSRSAIADGTYIPDEAEEALTALGQVPSLSKYLDYDLAGKLRWTPPRGTNTTPKDVYRTILTTAHFQDDGNIGFEIILKPPQIKQLL